MDIRSEVRKAMGEQKITGHKLAPMCGMTRGMIYAWLRGESNLGQAKIEAIFAALHLTITPQPTSADVQDPDP